MLYVLTSRRQPYDAAEMWNKLREKWSTVPSNIRGRINTKELLGLSDSQLLTKWKQMTAEDMSGEGYQVRGWYRSEYKDQFSRKKVLDVGYGLGADGVTFAQSGADVTFLVHC